MIDPIPNWKLRLYEQYVSTGQAQVARPELSDLTLGHFPYFAKLIRQHVPADRGTAIADLACGNGPLLYCLKLLGYSNIQGVDISSEQVALAHKCGLDQVECGTIEPFLADRKSSFDVVFLLDILEHLTRDELFSVVDSVHRSLRPNGSVIIHVPNAEGWFGMRIRYGDLTHETCFTPRSASQLLTACGFTSTACYEDTPTVHGFVSAMRYLVYHLATLYPRVLLAAETGNTRGVFSQNMLVTARKPA